MLKTAPALALALAVFAAAGCYKTDYSQSGPAKNSTSTADPNAIPENSKAMNPVVPPNKTNPSNATPAAGTTTQVQLTEYEIRMPDTLPAGESRLQIANAGKEDHGFNIEGAGYATSLPEQLKRGDVRELVVNLKPGSYTVWCPVEGHRGKGMQKTVTVH